MEGILEELLQHREPEALQRYLRKVRARAPPGGSLAEKWVLRVPVASAPAQALSTARHPLGKLLRTLMLTFQATYTGVGANKHLQELAQEEVKQHACELWAAYR